MRWFGLSRMRHDELTEATNRGDAAGDLSQKAHPLAATS